MPESYEIANAALVDLLEILYWRVFGMGMGDCKDTHVSKSEVLALLDGAKESLEGK